MATLEDHPLSLLYLERVRELVKNLESLKHINAFEGRRELDLRMQALKKLSRENRLLKGHLAVLQATLFCIHN